MFRKTDEICVLKNLRIFQHEFWHGVSGGSPQSLDEDYCFALPVPAPFCHLATVTVNLHTAPDSLGEAMLRVHTWAVVLQNQAKSKNEVSEEQRWGEGSG